MECVMAGQLGRAPVVVLAALMVVLKVAATVELLVRVMAVQLVAEAVDVKADRLVDVSVGRMAVDSGSGSAATKAVVLVYLSAASKVVATVEQMAELTGSTQVGSTA